ncbi:MAG: hypothetical protein ACSLE1_20930 [Sphingobium sp.]
MNVDRAIVERVTVARTAIQIMLGRNAASAIVAQVTVVKRTDAAAMPS